MNLKLYFQYPNRSGGVNRELVCSFEDKNQSVALALQDLKRRCPEYKSYYQRTWEEDGKTWIDFGSWSEFYIVVED